MERLRNSFRQALAEALPGQEITLERPRSGDLGDLAFPCFRCARLSRWCIKLLGVLQGIPRELVSLLAEFMIG